MNKRKYFEDDELKPTKNLKKEENVKKNSLDSDEEDEIDETEYMLDEDDIEGEEEGVAGQYDEVRTTAFNMREEREEGHFDENGHFIWKKEKEIKDNWLDNIDWQVIKPRPIKETVEKGLGDSDSEEETNLEEKSVYIEILKYMEPKETIAKTLQRLGKGKKKLTTIERIKMKKAGLLDTNEQVIKLTEIVNNFLTQTGNMDIYQETYESLKQKITITEKPKSDELDMYADDFDDKEKQKLDVKDGASTSTATESGKEVMWEFKWNKDDEKIEGPNTSEQMQKWVEDGYFKNPVWVRRSGQEQFYSSARIDFELYIS